jgi:hypothetical protein
MVYVYFSKKCRVPPGYKNMPRRALELDRNIFFIQSVLI